MPWHGWVIVYTMIAAGIAWTIIPNKSILLMALLAGIIAGCVWLLKNWPERWSKKKEEDREPL